MKVLRRLDRFAVCVAAAAFAVVLPSAARPVGRSDAIVPVPSPDCCPLWSPTGVEFAFRRTVPGGVETWLADRDGRRKRRLTGGAAVSWAPGGRVLVVARGQSLVAVDRGGRALARIDGVTGEVSWSPSGTQFVAATAPAPHELVVVSLDGRTRRLGSGFSPKWSPDGGSIAFVRRSDTPDAGAFYNAVFTIGADGGGERRLTSAGAVEVEWSPRSTHLAYIQVDFDPNAGEYVDVAYIVDLRTLTKTRLREAGGAPLWSPTADRVAVASVLPSTLLFAPDGVAVGEVPDSVPVEWAPGGARLLVQRGQTIGESPQLLLATADGARVQRLAGGEKADWSPDGTRILFSKPTCGSAQGVYLLPLAQRRARRVVDGCTIVGTAGPDALDGSSATDRVFGLGGSDTIRGGGGADALNGGAGPDRILGGDGSDVVDARDRARDEVDCGRGFDVARIDQRDRVVRCERVIVTHSR